MRNDHAMATSSTPPTPTPTGSTTTGPATGSADVQSKSQRAYDWLRERIANHEFGPGYRLVLGPIASMLGMSVVPVREAVRRLEAEGIVEYEHNVGARVTLVSTSDYVSAMQALGVVEGAAVALATPLLTEADLERAAAVNEQLQALARHFDSRLYSVVNREFHRILYTPCPNPDLLENVERGWARVAGVRDAMSAFSVERARASITEHAHLLELIRQRADPWEIELAARQHRWRAMEAFVERHSQPPLEAP